MLQIWVLTVFTETDSSLAVSSLATSYLFSAGFEPAGPTQVSPPET